MTDYSGNIVPGDCQDTPFWFPCHPYVTLDDACVACDRLDLDNPDDVALWEQMAVYASRRVFLATGSIYTECCQVTFHPCTQTCAAPCAAAVPTAVPVDGGWINCWPCARHNSDPCNCHNFAELPLPWWPARNVTDITIGGVTLNPASYYLDPARGVIYRTDGQPWPTCNSRVDPSVEWTVTYGFGNNLPPEGKPLLAAYVCQLVKLCRRMPCDLPVDRYREFGSGSVAQIDLSYRHELLTGYLPLDDWIMQLRQGRTIHAPLLFDPNPPAPVPVGYL